LSFFAVKPTGWIRGVWVGRYGNTVPIFIAGDVGVEIVPDSITVVVLIGERHVGAVIEIHPMGHK
tara:strand:- start:526 stop:720 length:195 start_codon:yes stop_codon:yes gene_type:complete